MLLEKYLLDSFELQLRSTDAAIGTERARLSSEADPERSLYLREKLRLLENFRVAIVSARTGLLLADGAHTEGETRFLKWRTAFVELLSAQDETQRCAKELETARAAIVPFQAAVDRADADVQNFRRAKRADYLTEPAKEKIRIELARLNLLRAPGQAEWSAARGSGRAAEMARERRSPRPRRVCRAASTPADSTGTGVFDRRALRRPMRGKQKRPALSSRHSRDCKVCSHPDRAEIEIAFVDWQPSTRIVKDFRLGSRQSLTRHAQACGLISKRNANIAAALASIVERGIKSRVSSRVCVQAIAVMAKINSRGRWIERRETLDLNQLFERMSQAEMLDYAKNGTLPPWFEQTIGGRTLERSTPVLEPAP